MHAFGLGYGTAFAACLAGSQVRWALQNPPPADAVTATVMIAMTFGLVVLFGWVLVYGSLLSLKDYDIRAAFRAADPRGWKTFAAGFLTGLGAVGAAVLVHVVIEPSGQERDLNTIRAGLLSFMSIGLGWIAGVILYLWIFRPRIPVTPPGGP